MRVRRQASLGTYCVHAPGGLVHREGANAEGAFGLGHCGCVWLAVAIATRGFIDALGLDSWQRYLAYVPMVLVLWCSASRIMDWARQRSRNAKMTRSGRESL